jgi:hypothetical protein
VTVVSQRVSPSDIGRRINTHHANVTRIRKLEAAIRPNLDPSVIIITFVKPSPNGPEPTGKTFARFDGSDGLIAKEEGEAMQQFRVRLRNTFPQLAQS